MFRMFVAFIHWFSGFIGSIAIIGIFALGTYELTKKISSCGQTRCLKNIQIGELIPGSK